MWIDNIETTVFSRVKIEGTIALKKTFPNINYTAENASDDEPKFPSIYVQELPSSEVGQDLEGTAINGILSSFQVDVSDNDNKQNCKKVMSKVVESMKGMRFEVIRTPIYRKEGNVWISTARFRRTIGFNDIL